MVAYVTSMLTERCATQYLNTNVCASVRQTTSGLTACWKCCCNYVYWRLCSDQCIKDVACCAMRKTSACISVLRDNLMCYEKTPKF